MLDSQKIHSGDLEWKRINMRNVEDLLGVEFIHDLYNRHEPRINSIRFRHTLTTWKKGTLNSYAPLQEWDRLGALLGDQYYNLDPLTIHYTRELYHRKRQSFHAFIKRLQKIKFSALSNEELAALLIHFQSIVLGELYVLNFVQVEHGLNTAVKKVIQEISENEAEAERLFSQLIHTEIPTASQREKQRLFRLAQKWRRLERLGLYNPARAQQALQQHFERYCYLYSAYGESPKEKQHFDQAFHNFFAAQEALPRLSLLPRLLHQSSRKELHRLKNEKLNILVPLLVQGGSFRDTNKALLGLSMKYRFAILDEIARRSLETRENLKFYLLSELCKLLRQGEKISKGELQKRKDQGVVVTRNEDFDICPESFTAPGSPNDETNQTVLKGHCASPGSCEGTCKVVLSKNDAHKVKNGDIMVAIGTDFDLIEAMYRSAAVITEEGGILSHASVVCRELNKPCCIGVKHATQLLKDNQRIRLNAQSGEIVILSEKK